MFDQMQTNFVNKVYFVCESNKHQVDFKRLEFSIFFEEKIKSNIQNFEFLIEFSVPIKKIRLPDYTWGDLSKNRIIPNFCNQILQLENDCFVQSTQYQGIWKIDSKNKNQLIWKFNSLNSSSLTKFQGKFNSKTQQNANQKYSNFLKLQLLFSYKNAIEISRSPMPFAAIVCFTDHCDFDTLDLLCKQRNFFKKNNIKITKGFFLNHFSKRADNASYERDFEELKKWEADGHELAYHSLSQSIKSDLESKKDFFEFAPVFNATTWIDHGFQPYNLSLYQSNSISDSDFARTLATKNIQILWNYIDSGTATCGVLNQLNPDNFTLQSFWLGTKKQSFQTRIALMVKIILVHLYNNEKLIQSYTKVAASFKKTIQNKSIFEFYKFVKSSCAVIFPLLKVMLFWNSYKNMVFANAKYCPLFFDHSIDNTQFTLFQTLELLDFKSAFEPKSIDKFVAENGVFIGHTYFSVPLKYHHGRLFDNQNTIDPQVANNFSYLASKIQNAQIWNPTLFELYQYWKMFNSVSFEVNQFNEIIIREQKFLISRPL